MSMVHYTHRHLIKVLTTQTRRMDIDPVELSRSHVILGRFLAGELLEHLGIESCEIQHPQGVRSGFRLQDEDSIVLLVFMRAGLYVGEGVRELLRRAPVFHVHPQRGAGLGASEIDMLPKDSSTTFVIVDAVINTGASLEPVLSQLRERGGSRFFVLSLVSPVQTARRLEAEHPDVHFLLARVSENQYIGTGGTDTGNRLFGTFAQRTKG